MVIGVLLKIMHIMHLKIEATRKAMEWLRLAVQDQRQRRRIRAQERARVGIYLDGDEEGESEIGSDDPEERPLMIRRMSAEDFLHYPEGEESETRHEEDEEDIEVEVEVEAAPTTTYDYDIEDDMSLGAEALGGDAENHEDESFEEEGEEDCETDYGSVALCMEDEVVYGDLDAAEYDNYRFMLLGEAVGVEHYIIKRLTYLRSLAVNRVIWEEIKELMQMQKEIQLEGKETRKRAIDYFVNKRRYMFHYEMGRIPPGERMEESDMPDEWAAVHYGWAGATEDERPDQTEVERGTVPGGGHTAPAGRSDDHAVGSSTDRPAATHGKGSKGKTGGKSKTNEPNTSKDPPMHDEYDDAQRR